MRTGWAWALALVLTAAVGMARAVIVETRSGERVMGYLVRKDGDRVVVRCRAADGSWTTKEFDATAVTVVETVSVKRLEGLRKEQPLEYRLYAEELAEKRVDPEARDMALRLFLIAAHLDPARLGRDCLKSMSDLAWDDRDKRAFRAMAFLLDPQRDPKLLGKADGPPRVERAPNRDRFIAALRAFRAGRTAEAARLARKEGVAEFFTTVPGLMSHKAFLDACAANEHRLPDDQLAVMLRVELHHLREAARGRSADAWSGLLLRGEARPVPVLTLEKLIPGVDPRRCLYKGGQWVEP